LDRGGKVFKQSAPVIKLPAEATEDDHLALIGLLNSSTACFWMKQVSQQKQLTGGDGVRVESIAKVPYEFAGTQLQKLPLPPNWETSPLRLRLLDLAKKTDQLAQELSLLTPSNAIAEGLRENTKLRNVWEGYQQRSAKIRSQMILLQEEIDFVGYCFYNLADESLFSNDPLAWDVLIDAGDRPFCILSQENQEGFAVPSEIPDTWTKEMREVWQRRIDAIENSSALKIIEHPHYKRRWIGRQGLFNHTANIDELQDACKNWLLDRLETYFDFDGRMQPSPPSPLSQEGRGGTREDSLSPSPSLEEGRGGTREDSLSPSPALGEGFRVRASIPIAITSIAKLADIAKSDSQFITVGELYRNDPAFKIEKLITELVEAESVPHMPILRYKPTGLRKRLEWEHTWELQRQEDDPPQPPLGKGGEESISPLPEGEGLGVRASIPVPPKYASTDFLKPNYWRLRGKLDVPKERWISFPHCQGEDGTLAIAWAGYNHLQLAQALSTYYLDIKERIGGSNDPRLAPLLASLVELIPWLKQWHNDIDPEFGLAMGDYYEGFLIEEAKAIGHTVESLRMWEPVGKVKSKK
ncbi:MAG: SAM-dependent methyltransferase, partial [Pseudanabaena sp. M165S2SP1A06QC]|nr:SAM-dependent methyltransferase [Pseudanabaena sp. M165S2SP1A06QC]